jgi:hypothetical protein
MKKLCLFMSSVYNTIVTDNLRKYYSIYPIVAVRNDALPKM